MLPRKQRIVVILLLFIGSSMQAQVIDNTATFRNISKDHYFRFHYDNDFFTKTDYYYSQGVTLEYAAPGLKKFPLAKLLWHPSADHIQYGLSANLFGYTPTSIRIAAIQYGDRPYSGAITVNTFLIAVNEKRKDRIATSLAVGVIGPLALGKPIQTEIHRWLENKLPRGWKNQIKNDLLLNYRVGYEKQLLTAGNVLLVNATAAATIGTVNNKASGGFNFLFGHFNDPYAATPAQRRKKHWQYYLYAQPQVRFIAYDATLQGGLLFNTNSPYTIAARDINRTGFQADAGAVLSFKGVYLTYAQSYLTKEFRTGRYHRWGGLSLAVSF